ncbi:MAG TPA: hypothetical protein VMX55_04120 [candidate division Zixibacteria bacterium]|nr:hypothetical protein [candidate division Zixibacteria bacterium]
MGNKIQQEIVVKVTALVAGFKRGMADGNKSIAESVGQIGRLSRNALASSKSIYGASDSFSNFAGIGMHAGNIVRRLVTSVSRAPSVFRGFSNTVNSFGQSITGVARRLVRFRMEMLSIMFFGMALSAMMFGLVRPAGTMAGIFELIGVILELFFLPVMLALLPVLLDILDWVINTPDEIKLLVGQIVLLVGAAGTFLALFGQLLLFLPSIGSLFLELIGSVSGLFGPFAGLAEGLLVLAGGAILVESAFKLWDFIGPIVNDVWDSLKESELFTKILETFGLTVEDIQNPFELLKNKVSEVVGSIAESLGFSSDETGTWQDKVIGFMNGVKDMIVRIIDIMKEFKTKFTESMAESGVSTEDLIKSVADLILKFIELLPRVAELLPDLIDLADRITNLAIVVLDLVDDLDPLWDAFHEGLMLINDVIYAYEVLIKLLTGKEIQGRELKSVLSFDRLTELGSGITKMIMELIPAFGDGGLVTKPTLALVGERGPEMITPIGQGGVSGGINITVHANTAGGVTADDIARVVEERLGNELRRLNHGF